MLGAMMLPVVSQEVVVIKGPELVACSVALEKFRREESKSSVENYSIEVTESPTAFEVVFIPNQPPQDPKSGRREITLGGKTIYGREVHYVVSKDTYKVIRTSFAR